MKQYQFSHKDECMNEIPSMPPPGGYTGHPDNNHEINLYIQRRREYDNHLASLKSIPVPKEYLNQFIDEKIYDETEINWHMKYPQQKVDDYIDTVGKCANCGVEFHIHKQKVDDTELWNEVLNALGYGFVHFIRQVSKQRS